MGGILQPELRYTAQRAVHRIGGIPLNGRYIVQVTATSSGRIIEQPRVRTAGEPLITALSRAVRVNIDGFGHTFCHVFNHDTVSLTFAKQARHKDQGRIHVLGPERCHLPPIRSNCPQSIPIGPNPFQWPPIHYTKSWHAL